MCLKRGDRDGSKKKLRTLRRISLINRDKTPRPDKSGHRRATRHRARPIFPSSAGMSFGLYEWSTSCSYATAAVTSQELLADALSGRLMIKVAAASGVMGRPSR